MMTIDQVKAESTSERMAERIASDYLLGQHAGYCVRIEEWFKHGPSYVAAYVVATTAPEKWEHRVAIFRYHEGRLRCFSNIIA